MTRTALLLVDHGSRLEAANAQLACVARLVRHLAAGVPEVRHAHMTLAPPTVAEAFDACVAGGATEIVVVPYMLAPGRHASEDIPALVLSAARRHPGVTHRVTAPLGVHALLGELVLARAGLAAAPREAPTRGGGCTLDAATCPEPFCRDR